MLETNNPLIDVDELMRQIKEEMQNRRSVSSSEIRSYQYCVNSRLNISHIEALINDVESRSEVRTQWPRQLNRFPFNRSRILRQVVLKIYEYLFQDQRSVNYSLAQALRESVKLNQRLNEQAMVIQTQLKEVQNIIELMRVEKDKVQEQIEPEDKL